MHGAILKKYLADFGADECVIMTAIYPENGALFARFCNFSDNEVQASFNPTQGKIICETDLRGNETVKKDNNTLIFRLWEIKTVKIEC